LAEKFQDRTRSENTHNNGGREDALRKENVGGIREVAVIAITKKRGGGHDLLKKRNRSAGNTPIRTVAYVGNQVSGLDVGVILM